MAIHQVPSDRPSNLPKGKVKDRRNRDLRSYQKTALSAVSNVIVKFVSQEAPGGGPAMSLHRPQSSPGYLGTESHPAVRRTDARLAEK